MHLVYFSPIALASFSQRPHCMAQALLRAGVEHVVWIRDRQPAELPAPAFAGVAESAGA